MAHGERRIAQRIEAHSSTATAQATRGLPGALRCSSPLVLGLEGEPGQDQQGHRGQTDGDRLLCACGGPNHPFDSSVTSPVGLIRIVQAVATLYRCNTPTDWLCPCGRVARALRREGIVVQEVVVGQ